MSRSSSTGSQPDRRHHRQPEREKRRKRGACIDPHGYDAGKKIKGKKRHILVDTLGLLLHAIVHPADIQDRDGGVLVMATLFGMFPFLKTLFADGGYQGPKFAAALAKVLPHLDVEIVKRSDTTIGFKIIPKRWIVGVSSQRTSVASFEGASSPSVRTVPSLIRLVWRKQDGGA